MEVVRNSVSVVEQAYYYCNSITDRLQPEQHSVSESVVYLRLLPLQMPFIDAPILAIFVGGTAAVPVRFYFFPSGLDI